MSDTSDAIGDPKAKLPAVTPALPSVPGDAAAIAKVTPTVPKTPDLSADALRAQGGLGTADDVLGGVGTASGKLGDMLDYTKLGATGAGLISDLAGDSKFKEAFDALGSAAETIKGVTAAVGTAVGYVRDVVAEFGPQVKYTFATSRSIDGVLDRDDWQVQSVTISEGISECYEVVARIATTQKDADPTVLVGADAYLRMEREPMVNPVRGIIRRVEQAQVTDDMASYQVHVVPAFALLMQRVGSRVFQDMIVPDILDEVLGSRLQSMGRYFDCQGLGEHYLKREYCVQYQESDFDFCCRLMEEEGIAFHFTHDGENELLVLTDDNAHYAKIETRDRLNIPISTEGMAGVESVQAFTRATQLTSTSVVVLDYDWTGVRTCKAEQRSVDAHGDEREVFEHSVELTFADYQNLAYCKEDSARQALIRHRERTRDAQVCTGLGFVLQMKPGMAFELTGNSNPDLNGAYLITKVRHQNAAPAGMSDDRYARQLNYHNVFECLPAATPFVPPRTRKKPRIYGVQSAWVMGPEANRVHTDEWGRVKLHFPWDRNGSKEAEDKRSCWVRVQQTFSGQGWGTVFIPHVGMEAIVTFLNGDPDRPLVTGTVYNGKNLPPYALPDRSTISTIKTVGNNELRFNDVGGGEEVYLHAQKNFNEKIENDHSTTVVANQTNTVQGSQTETIKGDQQLTVTDGNRTIKVASGNHEREIQGNESLTVHGARIATIDQTEDITVTGARTLTARAGNTITVTGDHNVNVSQKIIVDAGEIIVLKVKGTSIEISEAGIALVAQDGARVLLNAEAFMGSAGDTSAVSLTASSADVTNNQGGLTVAGGNIGLNAQDGAKVALDANVHAQSSTGTANLDLAAGAATLSGISVDLDAGPAKLNMADGKAALNSAESVLQSGSGSMVKADPAGVTIASAAINLN